MTIEIEATNSFFKHQATTKKIVVSEGGGRSGKTYSILQLLIFEAIQQKNTLISVVAENVPFLKRGAVRDFKIIMEQLGFWIEANWSRGNSIYDFGNGSQIEFFSADSPGKALGAARDVLFLNEANGISYEIAFQLLARTRRRVWIDYNPRSEFWVHTEILQNPEFDGMVDFVHSTFQDNHYLEQSIKDMMLARAAKDENYKRVYVQGLVGSLEGLIFPDFVQVDAMPEGRKFYGLDWGYSNDPSALVEVVADGENVYLRELIYSTGLQNSDIVDLMKSYGVASHSQIYADSAEPKSIDFVHTAGFNIYPVEKGRDSVNFGIDLMKQKNIHVTKDSVNLIKELRQYSWQKDKNGKAMNVPVDGNDHLIDAARYAIMMKLKPMMKTFIHLPEQRTSKI